MTMTARQGGSTGGPPEESVAKEWQALGSRANMFLVLFAGILIDLLFVLLWIITLHLFSVAVHLVGEVENTDAWKPRTAEAVFAISTLAVLIAFIVKDVLESIKRIWSAN